MSEEIKTQDYDVVVIGGGIGGMDTALNLGDMGFKVALVEKEPSIGGKMILLSKVFPTLDCASCISTPKVAAVSHHPNIKLLTYTEVKDISKESDNKFKVKVTKKARYVHEDMCTGCKQCESKCPVVVPDQFNFGLVGRKAVYIPFSTAVPKVSLIDLDNCVLCGACERVCPTNPKSIDFSQKPEDIELNAKSVVLATGFNLFPAEKIENLTYGKSKNVITSMEMERLLAPTRPFNTVLRPSDGKVPDKIAYVLCTGSRDRTVGNPICSQVCCMYSIKQAQLLLGALPLVDITIFYIDIRAFGKGYEEFYQQAKDMDVHFIKGKVAKITEKENGNLIVKYEDIENGGRLSEGEFDMVVLSVGLLSASSSIMSSMKNLKVTLDNQKYILSPDETLYPSRTNLPGIYVAGTASGPKDIPDSVTSAGSAASEVAAYIAMNYGKIKKVKGE
ncbi:MAG: FAD-dependent oxidoreductase [Thermoplasmata archaeon]